MITIDLPGRLAKLRVPASKHILPLVEAVVNSIHAIEDRRARGEGGRGRITVTVVRDTSQGFLQGHDGPEFVHPIGSVRVEDDGVGFTDENFLAFTQSDTTAKASRGGKGVGRLSWLLLFKKARVTSVFQAEGGLRERAFEFTAKEGVVGGEIPTPTSMTAAATKVELIGLDQKYQDIPRAVEALARNLMEHCVIYLLDDDCPEIVVSDDSVRASVNDFFREQHQEVNDPEALTVNGHPLRVRHLRARGESATRHTLLLCAHKRPVVTKNLADLLPDMGAGRLRDERGAFFLSSYVDGAVLDKNVNDDRTSFGQDENGDLFDETAPLPLADLMGAATENVRVQMAPLLTSVREFKLDAIRMYTQTDAPEYRPLLQHVEKYLGEIPPSATRDKDKLDAFLHRVKYRVEADTRLQVKTLLAASDAFEGYEATRDQILARLSDLERSTLAKYVTHRRVVLDILEKQLQYREDANHRYQPESSIHRIIFPMQATSDVVDFDRQNLWIVDERLNFHRHLSSDLNLSSHPEIETGSLKRPDLLVLNAFKGALAFGDTPQPSSLVILEFKQPGREQYKDSEDPVLQVCKYATEIREASKVGRYKDMQGRLITVANIPAYGFVLADLTPRIHEFARNAQLKPSPDGQGYYGWHSGYEVFLEIISYPKMLEDARRRNRAFFEKLGIG